jgi:hypothetical protein
MNNSNLLIDTERDEISSNNMYCSPWPTWLSVHWLCTGNLKLRTNRRTAFFAGACTLLLNAWYNGGYHHVFPRKDLPSPRWPSLALGSVESLRSISYPLGPKLDTGVLRSQRRIRFQGLRAVSDVGHGRGIDELIAWSALSSWTLDIAYAF